MLQSKRRTGWRRRYVGIRMEIEKAKIFDHPRSDDYQKSSETILSKFPDDSRRILKRGVVRHMITRWSRFCFIATVSFRRPTSLMPRVCRRSKCRTETASFRQCRCGLQLPRTQLVLNRESLCSSGKSHRQGGAAFDKVPSRVLHEVAGYQV